MCVFPAKLLVDVYDLPKVAKKTKREAEKLKCEAVESLPIVVNQCKFAASKPHLYYEI